MYYYIVDMEEDETVRVKAGSKKEAFRKWYRSEPEFSKLSDREIEDAYDSGNWYVICESDIRDI